MARQYDYLIVGAGLYGATFARLALNEGKRVMVIDKRCHAGGNLYCENIAGINVHRYGPHIFHTSDEEVWRFVTELVPFNQFVNSPLAKAPDGRIYHLPFNMNTFQQLWGVTSPEEAKSILQEQIADTERRLAEEGVKEPRNLEEQALLMVGSDIYKLFIEGYTQKQWGRPCSELPAFIIRRLPVRFTFDNNYFNDKYQGIPIGGYNPLIEKLLVGAEVRLGEEYFDHREYWDSLAERVVYTGPIDRYFDYRYGALEYRSLRFETEILSEINHQGNAVINYTSREEAHTRVIEHKHFEMFGENIKRIGHTVITREYPVEWGIGMEPYYPVNDERNQRIYDRYNELAAAEPGVVFGGRLAEYRYYDMAPTIRSAMTAYSKVYEVKKKDC